MPPPAEGVSPTLESSKMRSAVKFPKKKKKALGTASAITAAIALRTKATAPEVQRSARRHANCASTVLTCGDSNETVAELVSRQQPFPDPLRLLVVVQGLSPSGRRLRLASLGLSVLLEIYLKKITPQKRDPKPKTDDATSGRSIGGGGSKCNAHQVFFLALLAIIII